MVSRLHARVVSRSGLYGTYINYRDDNAYHANLGRQKRPNLLLVRTHARTGGWLKNERKRALPGAKARRVVGKYYEYPRKDRFLVLNLENSGDVRTRSFDFN